MRFVVCQKTDIKRLPITLEAVHLSRPISAKKLCELFDRRQVESISCSSSTAKRLKKKQLAELEKHGIVLEIEKRGGKPLQVDLKKMQQILELVHDHRSLRSIEKELGVPKSTVHYLVKYADRGKIKDGNKVVYLK